MGADGPSSSVGSPAGHWGPGSPGPRIPRRNPPLQTCSAWTRRTVNAFIERLQNPRGTETYFSVKARLAEGEVVEPMWLEKIRFDGVQFHGAVSNDPEDLRHVTLGSPWSVAPAEISDWMIIDSGRLAGGQTIRVLRRRMPPDGREEFDARANLIISD